MNASLSGNFPLHKQFIHGQCSACCVSQNIVFGIEDDTPLAPDTLCLKKYFQRMQKNIGREVFDWLDDKAHSGKPVITDMFGLSFSITDKDILRHILDNSHYVNIYYNDNADLDNKLVHLIRLYGSTSKFRSRYHSHKIRLCDQTGKEIPFESVVNTVKWFH